MSKNIPAIRKSIECILLCYPGSAGCRMYDPELFCLCFFVAAGRAAVRLELPLYPDHEVVGLPHYPDRVVLGRPHYAREVWALVPLHQTEVATFASGISWLGF